MIWYAKTASRRDEMREWFEKRTRNHVRLVRKYCRRIHDLDPERFSGIVERGEEHDRSKWGAPELDPYVLITWRYKCEDDGRDFWKNLPDGMTKEQVEESMDDATEHHVRNNRHHPEFHTEQEGDLVNDKDRDEPKKRRKVDATGMGDLDIAEMCADWCAVSEEKGNTPMEWADKNVGVRWDFDDRQEALIRELLSGIWGE